MSTFERIYHTDPSREQKIETERKSIELTDAEYLEKAIVSKGGYIYKLPIQNEIHPEFKEKFKIAKKLSKSNNKTDLEVKDAKDTSKRFEKKAKKDTLKSNRPTMAGV